MSAEQMLRARGKQGNIRVGNNVSATMCPRLPGPEVYKDRFSIHANRPSAHLKRSYKPEVITGKDPTSTENWKNKKEVSKNR